MPELFARSVATRPDAVAVVHGDEQLTYRDLDARSGRLAAELVRRGIGREDVVAVALPRSPDLVVSLLAGLRVGGAYLPVDADYPAERVAYLIGDSGARLILADTTTAGTVGDLSAPVLRVDLPYPSGTDRGPGPLVANTAYVIYTSGSTGMPKGVTVTHSGVASLVAALAERMAVRPEGRMLQLASPRAERWTRSRCAASTSSQRAVREIRSVSR